MVEELSRWLRLKDLRDDLEWYRSDFFARKRSQSLEETQDFEIHSYQLPYYLYLADQMSMMASIENRSPFLDVNLKKYVSYPDNFKVQNGWNKYVLRRSLPRIIPDEIRWRRGKSGMVSSFAQNVLRDQSVFDIIRASSLINELFDIEGMVRTSDGSCSSGRVDLINMLGVLYPLATLDRSYPLAI